MKKRNRRKRERSLTEIKRDQGHTNTGPVDLYKDKKGNIYVKPKYGSGSGAATGDNINDL